MKTKEEILTSHISFDDCHENFINKIYIAMQEYSDLTNAKLVESLKYLRSCYDLELLNKTKLVEENEVMAEDLKMKDAVISEFEEVQHAERKQINQLQSELSAAKERVKELEGSKWISVSDGLPDCWSQHSNNFGSGYILGLTKHNECVITQLWNDKDWEGDDAKENGYITHWMPLPTNP